MGIFQLVEIENLEINNEIVERNKYTTLINVGLTVKKTKNL